MTIQSIVFDVGNVLFAYDPLAIAKKLLPLETNHDDYVEHIYLSPIWQSLDRGDVTAQEAVKMVQLKAPHLTETAIDKLIQDFYIHLEPIVENHNLFTTISQKMPVYVLSNFQATQFDKLAQNFSFFKTSSGTTISAKINLAKPEKEIYTHHTTTFDLSPETTLFIDDLPENIEAARACGWQGIVYQSPSQLKSDLSAYIPQILTQS